MLNATPDPNTLPVMEAFYTLQGEGFHSGKPAYFIRLAGCDVGCTWCDVKESWNVSPSQFKSIDEIVEEASKNPCEIAVITGGEPCIYDLTILTTKLQQKGFKTHLETSGAYEIKGNFDWICVSPKKFQSPIESSLQKADELKVVIFHKSDFDWAEKNALSTSEKCALFVQPEFNKMNESMPLIVDYVKTHPSWRISLQSHKFIGIP